VNIDDSFIEKSIQELYDLIMKFTPLSLHKST